MPDTPSPPTIPDDPYTPLFPPDPSRPFTVRPLYAPSLLSTLTTHNSLFPLPDFSPTPTQQLPSPPPSSPLAPPPKRQKRENSTLFQLPADFAQPPPHAPELTIWRNGYRSVTPEEDQMDLDSHSVSPSPPTETMERDEEDIWLLPTTATCPPKPRVYTWESLLAPTEPTNDLPAVYISEAPTPILDAAIHEAGLTGQGAVVVEERVLIKALIEVVLGRESGLWRFDDKRGKFIETLQVRVSGVSKGCMESVVGRFLQMGGMVRRLRVWVEGVMERGGGARVALASCVQEVLESVGARLGGLEVRSLVGLREAVEVPGVLVEIIEAVVEAVRECQEEAELLERLFGVVMKLQVRTGWVRPVLCEILAKTTRPWLEAVEGWIGLAPWKGVPGFVGEREVVELDEVGKERRRKVWKFERGRVPSWIGEEMAEGVFEAGRGLRVLEEFEGEGHPLVRRGEGQEVAGLEWRFSWDDLQRLQERAKLHEARLRSAIKRYKRGLPPSAPPTSLTFYTTTAIPTFDPLPLPPHELTSYLATSSHFMSLPPPPPPSSHLSVLLSTLPQTPSFPPPLPTTPLLSFIPLLNVHTPLIHAAATNLLLRGPHRLAHHLATLHRYFLFGDGVFTNQLTEALFSPSLSTTERSAHRMGIPGTMSLRLGTRATWPPATSELRLALMDLIDAEEGGSGKGEKEKERDIPDVAFAIRDLSEAELEAMANPASLTALDFLKLEYRPPRPLDSVITKRALEGYDRIFFLLLRITRIVYVAENFLPPYNSSAARRRGAPGAREMLNLRFSLEARWFFTTFASYLIDTAISLPWNSLMQKLKATTKFLKTDASTTTTISQLEALHEATIDRILFAMLLRKRQRPAMRIIEEMAEMVLRFSEILGEGGDKGGDDGGEVEELFRRFRKRVEVLGGVVRGLSEKRGYAEGAGMKKGREEVNLLGMLVVRLEIGKSGRN